MKARLAGELWKALRDNLSVRGLMNGKMEAVPKNKRSYCENSLFHNKEILGLL